MTCEESEALSIFLKEHLAEVAVTETYLTLVSNGAGDTESLKSLTDSSSSVSSSCAALLDSDSAAYCVSPLSVFKTDRLDAFNELVDVEALSLTNFSTLQSNLEGLLTQTPGHHPRIF